MTLRRHRFVKPFAVALLALACQSLGQTRPALAPATQPTAADTDQLIRQLGDDDNARRDAAQMQLIDRGTAVVDALTKAAGNSEDPEIRSRAAAALSKIRENDACNASFITLHLKDARAQDVLDAIATQAHAQFACFAPGMVPGASNSRTLTLDVGHKPFWDVMTSVCQQLNVCPVLDTPSRNILKLFPNQRNWMLQSPHEIVGPFWVGVAGINRARSIDLMGPQTIDDQFNARLIVYAEPKLAVTQMSDFHVIEAMDDVGNSLIPAPPLTPAAAAANRMLHNTRQMARTVEARLNYPEHPGKTIRTLRGDIVVTLAQGVQQFLIDDVLGTPRTTNPLNHCQITAAVTHVAPDMFQVSIECTREGMDDEQWLAMLNRVGDISLEDTDGHALTSMNWTNAGFATSESTFKSTALFSRNMYNGQLLNRQITGKTGDAKRLIWNIAARLKPITVPVTFHDLPMP